MTKRNVFSLPFIICSLSPLLAPSSSLIREPVSVSEQRHMGWGPQKKQPFPLSSVFTVPRGPVSIYRHKAVSPPFSHRIPCCYSPSLFQTLSLTQRRPCPILHLSCSLSALPVPWRIIDPHSANSCLLFLDCPLHFWSTWNLFVRWGHHSNNTQTPFTSGLEVKCRLPPIAIPELFSSFKAQILFLLSFLPHFLRFFGCHPLTPSWTLLFEDVCLLYFHTYSRLHSLHPQRWHILAFLALPLPPHSSKHFLYQLQWPTPKVRV